MVRGALSNSEIVFLFRTVGSTIHNPNVSLTLEKNISIASWFDIYLLDHDQMVTQARISVLII